MAGGGGFFGNIPLGVLSSILQTVGYNQQSGQQRNDSIQQGQSALNIANGAATSGGGGFNFFGQDYATPDISGAMSNFTSGIADNIKGNTSDANAWMQNLNNATNDAYGQNFAAQLGSFNQGAQNLSNYQQQGANGLVNNYNSGAAGVLGAAQQGGANVLNQFGRADATNQARLGQMVGGLNAQAGSRQAQGMNLLQGLGAQAARNINTQFDANKGNISQDLASRGLGNSTVRESLLTGNERERANAQGNLQDQLRQQNLNTYTGLSGDTLNQANSGVNLQNQAAQLGTSTYTGLNSQNNANLTNLQSGLFTGGQNLQSGLQQQGLGIQGNNFANYSNLYNQLSNAGLNANLQGQQNVVNNQIQGGQNLTNWLTQAGGQNIANLQNANNNMQNIITGTSITQPPTPWSNIYGLGQGIGSYQGTRDAMAAQQSANQMGMFNPMNYLNGGANYSSAGGLGYNFGIV